MSRMMHDRAPDELLDLLSSHALDILDSAEASEVEEHVAHCAECSEQLKALRQVAAHLAYTAPVAYPAADLRERVLGLTRASLQSAAREPIVDAKVQVWKQWPQAGAGERQVVRTEAGDWEQVHPGVSVKRLYVDIEHDRVTMLIRMTPGAKYVPHRHAGPEQCYVLEGDLRDGEFVVRGGDYQCLPTGTVHGAQSTESGCLLLVVSSLHDELLT